MSIIGNVREEWRKFHKEAEVLGSQVESQFEAYVSAHGGIAGAVVALQADLSSAVSALSAVSGFIGAPASDVVIAQKAFADIQHVLVVAEKLSALLPAKI